MTVRVYHPETDEPFDVTQSKADDLRLNKGWRSQPLDPDAKPLVTDTAPESGTGAPPSEEQDWRDSEVGKEVVEWAPKPSSRRRSRKP